MLKLFSVLSIGNSNVNKSIILSTSRVKQVYSSNLGTIVSYIKDFITQEIVKILVNDTVSAVQDKLASVSPTSYIKLPLTYLGRPTTEVLSVENIVWIFPKNGGSTIFYKNSQRRDPLQYGTDLTLNDILSLAGSLSPFFFSVEASVGNETSVDGISTGVNKPLDVVAGLTLPIIFNLQKERTTTITITINSRIIDAAIPIVIEPSTKNTFLFEYEIIDRSTGRYPIEFTFSTSEGDAGTRTLYLDIVSTNPGSASGSGAGAGIPTTYDIDNSSSSMTIAGISSITPGNKWQFTSLGITNIDLKGFGTGHTISASAGTIQKKGAYYEILITAGTIDGFDLTSGQIMYQGAANPANGTTTISVEDIVGSKDSNVVIA